MAILVKEIMNSPVVSINNKTSLKDFCELLKEHDFSGVPVTDDDEKVVGIVTETDILHYTQQIIGHPVHRPYELITEDKEVVNVSVLNRGGEVFDLVKAVTVEKIMTREVVTVEEAASCYKVIKLMNEKKVNRIPVVSSGGKLKGIVSRGDIIKTLSNNWSSFNK